MRIKLIFVAVFSLLNCQFKLYECTPSSNRTARQNYLDDFIYDVEEQTQKQRDTECVKTVIRLLKNVQNHTLWASWIWDSMAKAPVSYLTGTKQIGNAKQCLNPPWKKSHPEFRTKFCLAHVEPKGPYLSINKTDSISPFVAASSYIHMPRKIIITASSTSWGLCLPESCGVDFMKTFMLILLKHNYFDKDFSNTVTKLKNCRVATDESKPLVVVDYVYIVLFAALTVLTVSSACLLKKGGKSTVMEIAHAFSFKENIDKLTRTSPEELDALNGIRFLSAALIVIYHYLIMPALFMPVNSILDLEEAFINDPKKSILYIAPLSVDTFFVLSGLLLVRPLMKALDKMQLKSTLKLIIKRYFRLAPIFGVAILALMHCIERTDGGPQWEDSAKVMLKHCYKSWWLSLLMLNNYVQTEEICHAPSWTVPVDFHMTVIAIGIIYLYSKHRGAGTAVFAIFLTLSVILPGLTTYLYDLPAIQDMIDKPLEEVLKNPYQLFLYVKTHNRTGSYAVGMVLGYVMSVYEPNKYKKSISKGLSILGTIVSFVFMVSLALMCGSQLHGGYSRAIVILFAIGLHTVYGIAVALLIVCLVYGTVPLINDFLCWNVFRPLARLSYGIYLLHLPFCLKKYSLTTVVNDLSLESLAIDAIGILVLTVMASFLTWILVESPINHLCNYWLKPPKVKDTTMTTDPVRESEMRESKNGGV